VALFGRFRTGQLRAGQPRAESPRSPAGEASSTAGPSTATPSDAAASANDDDAQPSSNLGHALEDALQVNPNDVDLAISLAAVLREAPEFLSQPQRQQFSTVELRHQAADRFVDQTVTSADTAEAFLKRFYYRQSYKLDGGEQDLAEALRREPDHPPILLAAATHQHQQADKSRPRNATPEQLVELYGPAEQHYRRAIALDPDEVLARLGLAELLRVRGDLAEAIAIVREGQLRREETEERLVLRLAELLIADSQLVPAREALEKFDSHFSHAAPRMNPTLRRDRDAYRRWLEAAWLLRNDQAVAAIAWVRPATTSGSVEFQYRAWYTLGQCYAAVDQRDRAAEAFTQAASLLPDALEPRLTAAQAWLDTGQPAQAIAHLQQALTITNSPDLRALLASAYLRLQSARNPEERDWLAFEAQMSALEAEPSRDQMDKPWLVDLLRVERRLVDGGDGDQAAAHSILQTLEAEYPAQPELFRRLVGLYESLGAPEDADRLLEACRGLLASPAEFRLLEAQLLAQRQRFTEAADVLARPVADAAPGDQQLLARGLVQTYLAASRWEDAQAELQAQHRQHPDNPLIMLQLGELRLRSEDFQDAAEWEKRLRQCEGEDGSYWRYLRVMRLLGESGSADASSPQLDEARKVLGELRTLRPAWAKTHMLDGMLHERREQPALAIDAYRQAVALGERSAAVYQRLSFLLFQAGRLAEAQQILENLEQSEVAQTEELSALAITLAASQDNLTEAIRLAERQVRERPDDVGPWLRYGQVLLRAKRVEEAQAQFARAAELGPEDMTAWVAQFAFLVRTNQLDEARRLIPRLEGQVQVPEAERQFVLAQAFEALADRQRARQHYEQAAQLSKDNVELLARMSRFFRDEDPAAAEHALRGILAVEPGNHGARRGLAVMLAARGEFDEVARLLEVKTDDNQQTVIDTRLRAALLLQQVPPELAKAEELLLELVRQTGSPADVDRLLLAQVYLKQREASQNELERDTKFKLAVRHFTSLCARQNPHPDHLRLFCSVLMQEQLWGEADQWLRVLEDTAPGNLEALALRCRWLQQQGRGSEATAYVDQFARRTIPAELDPAQQAARQVALGKMLMAGQLPALAETWLRQAVQTDARHFGELVTCLVRQQKADEAVRLCLAEAEKDQGTLPALTLANMLSTTSLDPEQAEPALQRAIERHPRDAELLSAVASLRLLRQGRTAEAVTLYRRALDAEPDNPLTLNNLAVILAEERRHDEALQCINRAIQLVGGKAPLLDTKGMVLLHAGQFPEAAALFRQAATQQPTDALFQFHLALTQLRQGQIEEARQTLELALRHDLLSQPLTPTDKQLLAELQTQLKPAAQ
ncbi:MAG: tetratricopeptide repeat protein, partial [Pirellulaceae bacterium]|nr:tetratricopeptide repeat protein [Pirellulaceae bacterium]